MLSRSIVLVRLGVRRSLIVLRLCTLRFTRALGVAAYDFDPISMHLVRIVKFEVDIFDDERPNVVAEAIGVKMSLRGPSQRHRLRLLWHSNPP